MTVAHEESDDAVDALALAVTDTPVPDALRADERFMAEHAAAVADVEALRAQLRVVGDTLARGPQGPDGPAPALPPAAPFRRPGAARRRAVLALAAALAAGMLGGLVWLGANAGTGDGDMAGGDGAKHAAPELSDGRESAPHASKAPDEPQDDSDGAGDSRSREGYVACARLIVEGTVHRVEALPGGTRERITFDVSRYYKPAEGKQRITFMMSVDTDVEPRPRAGDRALIGITEGEDTPDLWTTGKGIATDRAWIEKALPGARGAEC
ncbi:hypothetical protein [Streptomyces alboflavus]|uniref:hypothetical protein n=1 Tax=Streptomyces alboflavus TaxID=67267 RepID=UPI0036A8C068